MKSINAEEAISGIKTDLEPMQMNVTMMNRRIKDNSTNVKDLWAAIEALKNASGASIPMPIPAAQPKIDIPEGNIDANLKNFMSNLESRIAKCEGTDQEHYTVLDNHE